MLSHFKKFGFKNIHSSSRTYWTPKSSAKSINYLEETLSNQNSINEINFTYKCSIKHPNIVDPENPKLHSIYEVEIFYKKNNILWNKCYTSNSITSIINETNKFIEDNSIPIDTKNIPLNYISKNNQNK